MVMCNGMGRGGSTLQYNLARRLVEKCRAGVAHGYMVDGLPHAQHVPHETVIQWSHDPGLHVVKAHEPHSLLGDLLQTGAARVCYIYRDLRDVALSRRTAFGERGDRLIDTIADHVGWYHELSGLRDQYPDAVVWQRYETVIADLPGAVREIATVLALSPDDDIVYAVDAECGMAASQRTVDQNRKAVQETVDALRAENPRLAGMFLRLIGRSGQQQQLTQHGDDLLHHNHISRRQGASAWRDHLDHDTRDAIETRFGSYLRDAGYEV